MNKLKFWKILSKYLIVSISCLILLATFSYGNLNLTNVYADPDNCATDPNQLDCGNPGFFQPGTAPEPVNPAPVQPTPRQAAPVCTPGDYNRICTGQCGGCAADAGEARILQCRADGSGFDEKQSECRTECAGACQPAAPAPAQPAAPQQPAPAPQVCTPNSWDGGRCARCKGDGSGFQTSGSDWDVYNGVGGSWCSCAQRFGGSFTSATYPQCFAQPAPAPAAPAPAQPAPQQPAPQAPANPLPACNTLANNIVCGGQRAYDTCNEFTQGGVKFLSCVASQNSNCTGVIQCSQPPAGAPAPGPVQNADIRTQCPNGTTAITSTNNVITCISNSNQNQNTVTNNNNSSAVINIPGGIVTRTEIIREQPVAAQVAKVECPAGTVKKVVDREIVCEVTGRPFVSVAGAKELPKTGLPALAWAIGAFVPMGMKLRKFAKGASANTSNPLFIWEDRKFKSV